MKSLTRLSLLLFCLVIIGSLSLNAGERLPERIVSLAPSSTEILFALGLDKQIVGLTTYCNYPASAKKKAKVGDMNANVESIIALKPDLVVAHAKLNDNVMPRLKGLGIRVAAFDPKTFVQVYANITALGKITGHVKQSDAILRKMKSAVSSVKAKTVRCKPRRVLVIVSPNPLWVAGPQTFVDEMIRFSRGTNIASDAKPGFNQFSTEVAVTRNPDVIIVSRSEEKEFVMNSSLWKRTNAVKRKAVYVVDGDLMFRPGPRLTLGLQKMAQAIHPEAFK